MAHNEPIEDQFYLSPDEFFPQHRGVGLTYDDVSLATNFSSVLPRQTDLSTRLNDKLQLRLPIISSDMDTVTEAEMAIGMALNGALGLLHANVPPETQIKQVARVKHHSHGLIKEPITARPDQLIGDVLEKVAARGFGFRTFPVVDEEGVLLGLLPGRVVKQRYAARAVREAMTPREQTFTIHHRDLGENHVAVADRFFSEHLGIHKLLVVDDAGRLCGLFTLSDIERIFEEADSHQRPARDDKFRLLCGASVAATRNVMGELDRGAIAGHVGGLVEEGLDVVAVSTAHGHSEGVGETVRLLRSEFPELAIIAGNVTSAEGVQFLAEAGADAVKVGQGPGSICTTRVVAGVGIPQLTALYICAQAARQAGVAMIADGGVTKSGDMVKALVFADAVMCGSLLAGCREAPGKIIEISGKFYKQYRGMGSLAAMKAGSAARYGHEKQDAHRKLAAEGIEALKELSGSVDEVLAALTGGIQSGLGYLGATNLDELRRKARLIRVSPASQREASPHDVVEVRTTKEGD